MLRKFPQLLLFTGMAVWAPLASADTVTLTSGEKIEGKIVGETATELTVEVKISASVTDETRIAKSKVTKIERVLADEVAWQSVKAIKVGPNSLQPAQYDALAGPLQGFVNEFPKSSHAAEAATLLATITDERARVEAGEVRLGERWLSKEEVSKERYQINAQLALQYLLSQRAAGDLTGALNSFDALEKNYPNSRSYPDAVDAAKAILASLKTTVDRAQATYNQQLADYEAGLAQTSESLKPELMAARQQEQAQGEAAVAAAERAGLKWPPLVPRSDKSFAPLLQKIPEEQQRLASIETAKFRQSAALADQARREIATGKRDAAGESIRKATELWGTNEMLARLQTELNTARASAAPVPAALEPAPAEMAPPTPAPTTPPPAEREPATAEGDAQAEATPEPAPPEPEEKSFFATPLGFAAIVLLLAAGGGAYFMKKRKPGGGDDDVIDV